MRGRISEVEEAAREGVEGNLAILGNARVLMRLVMDRLELASKTGQTAALPPARDDLARADQLITRVQARIKTDFQKDEKWKHKASD